MVVAIMVFLNGLNVERLTFPFDAATMADRWNQEAAALGRPELAIGTLDLRPDGARELVFAHGWSDTFLVKGRVDEGSGSVVEISVIGNRHRDGGQAMVDAMELVVAVTEPTLGHDERIATLMELGVVAGDPLADLSATRNNTDYVVAATPAGDSVGMSAAPHSRITSGRR